MRWPWQRQRQPVPDVRAVEAVADAEAKLSAQRQMQAEVDRVTQRLIDRRRQNRFAEMVEDALRRQA